jgi:ABC-type cobalamin/Fe3+-siderophores transport system ATPase subunit
MLKDGVVHSLSPRAMLTAAEIEEVYGVKVIISQVNENKVVIPMDGELVRSSE